MFQCLSLTAPKASRNNLHLASLMHGLNGLMTPWNGPVLAPNIRRPSLLPVRRLFSATKCINSWRNERPFRRSASAHPPAYHRRIFAPPRGFPSPTGGSLGKCWDVVVVQIRIHFTARQYKELQPQRLCIHKCELKREKYFDVVSGLLFCRGGAHDFWINKRFIWFKPT